MVGHEIERRARNALELCGAFRAGEVVADAKCVAFEFKDRGESPALVRSFGADDGHALGRGRGIDRVSAPVGLVSDKDFIPTVIEFEADDIQDSVAHGLSRQLGRDGLPVSLNCLGVVVGIGSPRAQ